MENTMNSILTMEDEETHRLLLESFKELENKYETLKTMECLRESLTQMMVHDMRNLLQGMQGTLEIMQVNPLLDEIQKKHVHTLYTTCFRAAEMNSTVLDLSRLEQGKLPLKKHRTDVVHLIIDAVQMLGGPKNGCAIDLPLGPRPRPSRDPELIKRVIFNLVGNAVKFAPCVGGRVKVRTSLEGGAFRVMVQDNGPGIPGEYQHKIFEKFAMLEIRKDNKIPTTGLGLAFCKMVLDAHGGAIGVRSESGQGSTFWFELPV